MSATDTDKKTMLGRGKRGAQVHECVLQVAYDATLLCLQQSDLTGLAFHMNGMISLPDPSVNTHEFAAINRSLIHPLLNTY